MEYTAEIFDQMQFLYETNGFTSFIVSLDSSADLTRKS
jgi:hypothetical protein